MENPSLQSPKNIVGAANNLAKITREVLQKDQTSAVTQVLLRGIKQISQGLHELVEEKLKAPGSEQDEQDFLLARAHLQLCLRRTSGGTILTSIDETSKMDTAVREKFNLERAASLYYEARDKIGEAISAGHVRYSLDTDLEKNQAFKTEFLEPALAAAQLFADFMLKEAMEDKASVSRTVSIYVGELGSKVLAKAKGLGKVTVEAVLPILEKVAA